jgi:hypothetical protein
MRPPHGKGGSVPWCWELAIVEGIEIKDKKNRQLVM